MFNLFKQAVRITNYNIILAIPLIIFIKILDLYSIYSKYVVDSSFKVILYFITVLCVSGAFFAGWFYMIRKAIELSKKIFVLDSDRAKETLNLFKVLPEGIGKYFLSFAGFYIIMFFIQIIATPVVYFLGLNLIGQLDNEAMLNLQAIASDPATVNKSMTSFVENLTPEQIVFFGKWSLLFMAVSSIIIYFLMLWIPEIIYNTHNPLKALGKSFVKLLKNFTSSIKIYLSLWFAGFGLLFLNTFAFLNPITYIIMNIIIFYFTVYAVVSIFLYYEETFLTDNIDEK